MSYTYHGSRTSASFTTNGNPFTRGNAPFNSRIASWFESSCIEDAFDMQWTLQAPQQDVRNIISAMKDESDDEDKQSYLQRGYDSDDSNEPGDNFPPEPHFHLYHYLRYRFFTVYRRLFAIVFVANLAALIALLCNPGLNTSNTLTAVSINLTISILIRDQFLVDILFLLSCSLPLSTPLLLRRWFAKIYSYGGMHAGCGVSATCWFIAYAILVSIHLARSSVHPIPPTTAAIAALTYFSLLLLLIILALAHPTLRSRAHNTFEATHRYTGWTVVLIFWALCILSSTIHPPTTTTRHTLTRTPTFYCLLLITISILHPWLQLRRRRITHIDHPSPHAVRLYFATPAPTYCTTLRISDNMFRESHAFACIPNAPCTLLAPTAVLPTSTTNIPAPQATGFSLLISNAGDWTARLIAQSPPPAYLYTKGRPTLGVLRVAAMFRSVVVAATGSGIGPCLSLFAGRPDLRCRVVWSAPDPVGTFGQDVVDVVRTADCDGSAVVIDTRARAGTGRSSRPDLTREIWKVWKASGAEAVFLISNPRVTQEVIYGLEVRGVPAFAPIFDS